MVVVKEDSPVMELYKKYRPSKLSEVIGQDDAVEFLRSLPVAEIPHCILLTGPSGCGKTTIARIIKRRLRCHDSDFKEMNTADFRGIDMVRDVDRIMRLAPMAGRCRVWLVDECHKLTSDAQDAFLKILEDTPLHVYFMLATTDPQRLKATVRTRATEINLVSLTTKYVRDLVVSIAERDGMTVEEDVVDKIIDLSMGSARKALVFLGQVKGVESDKRLAQLKSTSSEEEAIKIARTLMGPSPSWKTLAPTVKACNADPEGIRRLILGYCSSIVLSGGSKAAAAYSLMECFRDPLYDIGKPGLVMACYEALEK